MEEFQAAQKRELMEAATQAARHLSEQQAEIDRMTAGLVKLSTEYNKLRQQSAQREDKLERMQLTAQLGARDNLDASDELAYLQALRGAAEAELMIDDARPKLGVRPLDPPGWEGILPEYYVYE